MAALRRRELPFVTSGQAILANGDVGTFDIHSVTVLLDSRPRDVDVYVSDTAPLVGMRLLDSHSLCVDVESGGPSAPPSSRAWWRRAIPPPPSGGAMSPWCCSSSTPASAAPS